MALKPNRFLFVWCLLLALLLGGAIFLTGQSQFQLVNLQMLVFTPPRSGGTSADEQVTVQIANGGTSMVWCDMLAAGNCPGATQSGGNSFNPQFSALWAGSSIIVGTNRATTITSCTPTACVIPTFSFSDCTSFCTLRVTNVYLNSLQNNLLTAAQPYVSGTQNLMGWNDVEMSGSINVTGTSGTISFGQINQHCTTTSPCNASTFACSAAWNGLTFQIWDSGTNVFRAETLTNCTTMSPVWAGATGTFGFNKLFDFTLADAAVAANAINGKKASFVFAPASSSGLNLWTPAYVNGTDWAIANQLTQATAGCTASTTINSNLILFSAGCNVINWAGTITITGVTALVIQYCIPGGINGYTSSSCIAQANASATVAAANFTWIPSALSVCFATSYPGGQVGTVINGITYGPVLSNACGNGQLGSAPLRISQNPTGTPVPYSYVWQQAWQPACKAFLQHYQNNANIDYVRCGGTDGGEWFPFAQVAESALVPSATVSDPPFTRYLLLANNDSQNAMIQAAGLTSTFNPMSSANNCLGAVLSLDWMCAQGEFSSAINHLLHGIGSQGFAYADLITSAGAPASGDWVRAFDQVGQCQSNGGLKCPAGITASFITELQQAGQSDPYNTFFGRGAPIAPTTLVCNTGRCTVTFTLDPTANVRTDGTQTITLGNWPIGAAGVNFNGTFQVVGANAGAKTITFIMPRTPNDSSTAIATTWAAGAGSFGTITLMKHFMRSHYVNRLEWYIDDSLTINAAANDTYHGFIASSTYFNGVTFGATWLKDIRDLTTGAIQ